MVAIGHEVLGHPTMSVLGPVFDWNDDQLISETYVPRRIWLGKVGAKHIFRQAMLSKTEPSPLGPRRSHPNIQE